MKTYKTNRLLTKEKKTKSLFSWFVFCIVKGCKRDVTSVNSLVKFNLMTTHAQGCRLGRFVVDWYRLNKHMLKLCHCKEGIWVSQLMSQGRTLNIWQTL